MKVLHVEDDRLDAELIANVLAAEWPDVRITVVASRETYTAALSNPDFDVVLSDFTIPGFGGREALDLLKARHVDIPLIFVSGTIGEERAAESIRLGAADYVLKDSLRRLPSAVRRARAEAELRRERAVAERRMEQQADMLDRASDGIVIVTADSTVDYWNEGAERIFGWSRAEVIGRNVNELFGDAASAGLAAAAVRDAGWRGELTVVGKTGRPVAVDLRITGTRGAASGSASKICIFTDVTERKLLQEQFLRAQRLECLGMLAAGIAHDLNNALAPMVMAGQMLKPRVTDAADLRILGILESSAARSAELVRQILAFAGGRSDQKLLIQPKHLLRDLVAMVQDTFPKSIQFEMDIPSDLSAIRANATQLHQVVLNLCINSRDAMPAGGRLRLTARNEVVSTERARTQPGAVSGPCVVLHVEDTGTGITPENLARIWEPFFTTKGPGKGTGLGLSTVRGIVIDHGGFVDVTSAVGRGTVIEVFIPAEAAPAEAGEGDAGADAARRGNGELVLIVDDQEYIRDTLCDILGRYNYRTLIASDGLEALTQYAARTREIALVITDVDMPMLGGTALANAILRINPNAAILSMSGTTRGDVLKPPAGARQAFLPKPFTADKLLAAVGALLQRRPAPGR